MSAAAGVVVRPMRPDELPWVNGQYALADFVRSDLEDTILVAEVDGERAGVGRLVPAGEGHVELGGMYVVEAHRGRGVARALVEGLLHQAQGRTVWCIPYARVQDLYRGFGFADPPDGVEPPPAVVEKLRFCRARYPVAVVLLRRAPGSTTSGAD